MDLARIADAVKAFFPKYANMIDQAKQMTAKFSASPDGVRQLMQQMGKNQEDLNRALGTLNNPLVAGALNRIQPGLADQLKSAGQAMGNAGIPAAGAEAPAGNDNGSTLDALRRRLGKL